MTSTGHYQQACKDRGRERNLLGEQFDSQHRTVLPMSWKPATL
jgi:hypothetical protein